MKKLISFAVAVVMLLSLSIPMTFAADSPKVTGPATTKGSVVGLKVDGVKVTSSADYIDKMGYAKPNSGWTAIETVEQFKNAVGGKFYIAKSLVFTETDNVLHPDYKKEVICQKITADTTIDGCGYSITGISFTNTKAMLYYVGGSKTLNIKNLSIGIKGKPVVMNGGSQVGFSVLGNVDGKSIVDNVSIWAELSSTGNGNVAGFHAYAGDNSKIVIKNSEMNGSITGTGELGLAGFVAGSKSDVDFENCVNNASITLTNNAGNGVAGFLAATSDNQGDHTVNVKNCVNNGAITHNGTAQIGTGVAGLVAARRGFVNFVGCVNNGTIKGYSVVGGIGATTYNFHNRKTFDSCTNNGTVTATGGKAHAIYAHVQSVFETSNTMEKNNTNKGLVTQTVNGETTTTRIVVNVYTDKTVTHYEDGRVEAVYNNGKVVTSYADKTVTNHIDGRVETIFADGTIETVYTDGKVLTVYADKTVTDYADGRVETVYNNGTKETVLSTVDSEATAFVQMSDAYEAEGVTLNDVRFILVLSEDEYKAAAADLTFKISFKLTDGTVISKDFNEIVAFRTTETDDHTYTAADGVVICGVIVEDVPTNEWSKCRLSYNGNAWTYADVVTLVSVGKSNVSIVYNDSDVSAAIDSAKELQASLEELGKVEIPTGTAPSGNGIQILVGETGDDASKAAMDALEPNSYSITTSLNKIIVVANNIYLYSEAIEDLLGVISASGGIVTIDRDYSKTSDSYPVVELSSGNTTDYTIIYESGNSAAASQASALQSAFAAAGINIGVSADTKSASGKEILLGETNRALSSDTQTYYKSATFGFGDNGSLAIKGELEMGVTSLIDAMSKFIDSDIDIAIPHYVLKRKTVAGYGTAPQYGGSGTETVMENFDSTKSYVVQQDGAKKTDFSNYAKLLKAEGYELYHSTTAQESSFATYTDGHNIVYLSYVQYTDPFEGKTTVRYINIAIDSVENSVLPTLEDNSKYVCELQVSLLNAHNTWLIRLEDGRFVIIDGGLVEANGRNNADLIYNTLVAQNVLQGNPVIAAWLITHPHTDHVDAYYDFTQRYKDKVDLQMVIANMPNRSVEGLAGYSTKIYNGVTKSYPNAKFAVAHAGQRFVFAGLELDVLWTHENLYGITYGDTNLSSSIFSLTMPGGRLIITGDQQWQGCKILNAIYREELKCDVVQICHHGLGGGDRDMYLNMDPKVAVWPYNYEELIESGSHTNETLNNIKLSDCDIHLVMSVNDEVMTLRKGMTAKDLKKFKRWS